MPSTKASQELHMCVKVSCEGQEQNVPVIHIKYMNIRETMLNKSYG